MGNATKGLPNGNLLDRISDDLPESDFHYVGIKSAQDPRINGFDDILELVVGQVDFDKYNVIFVRPCDVDKLTP